MELFVVIVFCFATAHGLIEGSKQLAQGFRSSYRRRVESWRKTHKARPAPAGVKVGKALSAATFGSGLLAREFGAGARTGWSNGKQAAYDWRVRRTEAKANPDQGPGWAEEWKQTSPAPAASEQEPAPAVTTETPAGAGTTSPIHTTAPAPGEGPAKPALTLVRDPETPTPLAPPEPKEDAMSVLSPTGGEILSMQDLIAELDATVTQAHSEVEDAQSDVNRAAEEMSRIEGIVASLQGLHVGPDDLTEVSALLEPTATQKQAAENRAAAAELRLKAAEAAKTGVLSRHGAMAEAVAVTPHVADRQFYVGG